MKRLILVILFFILTSSYSEAQYWGQEHQRDSWYIGFGIGSGTGWLTFPDKSYTFNEYFEGLSSTTVTLNFKVGGTLSPYLLFGFDITAIRRQGTATDVTAAVQINNYDAMLTYFPMKEGLFLRGGAGLSAAIQEINAPDISHTGVVYGGNLLGGIGYAFWLLKSFNLTLNLDYSYQFYNGTSTDPKSSSFLNIYLGFDWY